MIYFLHLILYCNIAYVLNLNFEYLSTLLKNQNIKKLGTNDELNI